MACVGPEVAGHASWCTILQPLSLAATLDEVNTITDGQQTHH